MIDTDKYEGHTEGKWDITMDDTMEGYYFFRQGYDREQEEDCDYDECRANARLMSDAPLLLAEVKRLREATQQIIGNIELWCNGNTVPKDILMEKLKEMIE